MRSFVSDNTSGAHSRIIEALSRANSDHASAYGEDRWTEEARGKFQSTFGEGTRVYLVFNGTGANVLCLLAGTTPGQGVICAECAHIYQDEAGAPELLSGCKIMPIPSADGLLRADDVQRLIDINQGIHRAKPAIISVTHPNELGLCYPPEELRRIAQAAHTAGLLVHMDGARLANAAAASNTSFRAITRDLGVDLLSFGGTKNGLLFGEAVLSFNSMVTERLDRLHKASGQLSSKTRFIAAQFCAYLDGELWRQSACHANEMAQYLAEQLRFIEGVSVDLPVQVNMVFVRMTGKSHARLSHRSGLFAPFDESGRVRFVTSFDTSREDVDALVKLLRES